MYVALTAPVGDMASADIENLTFLRRIPDGTNLLPLLLYLPFGAVFAVIRCFIFAHALLVFFLFSWIPFVQSFILRVMLAVCGLVVVTDGAIQPNHQRLVLVANHVTSLDPFILTLVMRCAMVLDSPACFIDFVHLSKQIQQPPEMSKEDTLQHAKKCVNESSVPLLFFPEGGRSDPSLGLLKFRSLPFQLDTPIQPIAVTGKRGAFSLNISCFNSAWWVDLLLCFFVPITFFTLKFMPVTQCRESETGDQFALRVHTNLAKSLGVPATEISHSDITEALKSRQRQQLNVPQTRAPTEAQQESEAQPQEAVTSSDPELCVMLRQVQEVLPYATSRAVLTDLENTRDVDVTITNILEGRVNMQQQPKPPELSASQKEMESATFKASDFPRSASERQMSLQERKQAMLEAARARYKEKHCIP